MVTDSSSMAAVGVMPDWFSCTRVFTKSSGKVDIHPTEITAIASVSECSLCLNGTYQHQRDRLQTAG